MPLDACSVGGWQWRESKVYSTSEPSIARADQWSVERKGLS